MGTVGIAIIMLFKDLFGLFPEPTIKNDGQHQDGNRDPNYNIHIFLFGCLFHKRSHL
jgi:hypothetical protein